MPARALSIAFEKGFTGFAFAMLAAALAFGAASAPSAAFADEGLIAQGVALTTQADAPADGNDMYRLYNPNSGEHFYTADISERDAVCAAGWSYEAVGWVAPVSSGTPVYRLYNPNAGDHHYTMSADERNELIAVGWRDEGIGWYSDDAQTVPLYRQYNPNAVAGSHNFTTSAEEDANLGALGWAREGVAWYALEPGQSFKVKREAENYYSYDSNGNYAITTTLSDFESTFGYDYEQWYATSDSMIVALQDVPYGMVFSWKNSYNKGRRSYDWYSEFGTVSLVRDAVEGDFEEPMTVDRFAARLVAPKPFSRNSPANVADGATGGMDKLSFLGQKVAYVRYSGLEALANEGDPGAGYGEEMQIVLDENGLVSPDSLCLLWGIAG